MKIFIKERLLVPLRQGGTKRGLENLSFGAGCLSPSSEACDIFESIPKIFIHSSTTYSVYTYSLQ